jgi:uncharacterized protein (DUF924 family)
MPNYRAADVLAFWFGEGAECGKRHKYWFEKQPGFDAQVTQRFLGLYEEMASGRQWLDGARERLARIVVLDQLARNMFRGTPRAFAADPLALETAKLAVQRGDDPTLLPVERMFVYLPFEHSEALEDQEQACALTESLGAFPETADAHRYAIAHRDIIRRFGRFPHRNSILGRACTAEELDFLKQPGSSF